MKLISMTEFVLEQNETLRSAPTIIIRKQMESGILGNILNYANFLKKPLTLGMFVPCDEDGNVITHTLEDRVNMEWGDMVKARTELEQAKERVLFDNCSLEDYGNRFHIMFNESTSGIIYAKESGNFSCKTVEYLQEYGLKLTPAALKQIGL